METKLARISQLSKENPNMVFTSLGHLINKEMLKSCHSEMDGDKAVGIDGVTKEEYARNLDRNLESLVERLKKKSYKPKPAMMGFRPNRGCHKAIRKLNVMLERKPTNYVLDADISGFFQHLDHEWIIRFIESKIKDPNITRLVRRMLKAGIMNDYQFEETE